MWVICKASASHNYYAKGVKVLKEPVTRGKYKHPTSSNSKASASKKAQLSA